MVECSSVHGPHFGEGSVSAWDTEAECGKREFLNLVPDIFSLQLTNIW